MLVTETEAPRKRGLSYLVQGDGGCSRLVRVTSHSGVHDGRPYVVVYDSELRIAYDASKYLTVGLASLSENTRSQALGAIKLLCAFCEITGARFVDFDLPTARGFLQFLRGTLGEGALFTFRLRTMRSEATVAAYLKVYRGYATYLGIEGSPFLANSGQAALRPSGQEPPPKKLLTASAKEPTEAPSYVTVDQYLAILSAIDRGPWGLEERAICRLMFEHGLRLGEVLGLTLEDLEQAPGPDGTLTFAVVLRNRISDRPWQHAKSVMRVIDPRQYDSSDYRRRNFGYQRVYVSESVFGDVAAYVESSRVASGFDHSACSADGDGNQYVFCNTRSRPLSSSVWNRRLRRIFSEAGVPVDHDVRRTNLSHRFRHGYAMFLVRNCGKDGYEVKTLLRHRTLRSSEAYLRPTEEDVRTLQSEIIGELESALFGRCRDSS